MKKLLLGLGSIAAIAAPVAAVVACGLKDDSNGAKTLNVSKSEIQAFNKDLGLKDADVSNTKVSIKFDIKSRIETLDVTFDLKNEVAKTGDIPAFAKGTNKLEVISSSSTQGTINGKALTNAKEISNFIAEDFKKEVDAAEAAANAEAVKTAAGGDAALTGTALTDAQAAATNEVKALGLDPNAAQAGATLALATKAIADAKTQLELDTAVAAATKAQTLQKAKATAIAKVSGKTGMTLKATPNTKVTELEAENAISGCETEKEVTDYIATLTIA